jgi:hypothetical protein
MPVPHVDHDDAYLLRIDLFAFHDRDIIAVTGPVFHDYRIPGECGWEGVKDDVTAGTGKSFLPLSG